MVMGSIIAVDDQTLAQVNSPIIIRQAARVTFFYCGSLEDDKPAKSQVVQLRGTKDVAKYPTAVKSAAQCIVIQLLLVPC